MSDHSVCPVCGGEGPNAHEAKLAHLAKGEEVVSNLSGQADWVRPILAAINSGAWRDALGQIKRPKQDDEDES